MNFLSQLRDVMNDLIVDHWVKALVGVLVFVVTAGWGMYQAWQSLRSRTFYRRFHFSLNVISNGKLLIRTLDEEDADHVVLNNRSAVNALIKAAKRTTIADPFLHLDADLRWLVLNAALNELARIIPCAGLFHLDLGLPVIRETYVLGLTCEKDPDIRTRKVRLMVIRKKTLIEMESEEFKAPAVEQPSHKVRLETLGKMAKLFNLNPERLMEFEVTLPLYGEGQR